MIDISFISIQITCAWGSIVQNSIDENPVLEPISSILGFCLYQINEFKITSLIVFFHPDGLLGSFKIQTISEKFIFSISLFIIY